MLGYIVDKVTRRKIDLFFFANFESSRVERYAPQQREHTRNERILGRRRIFLWLLINLDWIPVVLEKKKFANNGGQASWRCRASARHCRQAFD